MSLLGLDIGTSGAKAIVFDGDGRAIANAYLEYDLIFPKPGWVEMDVGSMWKKIFNVLSEVNTSEKVKKDPVEALSVSTFGESFTPVDDKGRDLYNTIFATDTRSIKELDYITERIPHKRLYEINGSAPKYISPLTKVLWLKSNMPDIYNRARKLLFTEDLFFHKLGVEDTSISYSLASMTLFFDIDSKKWSKEILDKLDIDTGKFSTPSPSGRVVGHISAKVAEELGFKGKVGVVTGGNDQACAALGVGAVSEGISADGMGSFECITTASDKPIINDRMLESNFPANSHVVDGKYVTLAYNGTSGSVLKWFRDNLAGEERKKAKEEGIDFYEYIIRDLEMTPSNMLVLPYFAPSGTPYYDPDPMGTIIGLSLSTRKKDILKAFIEGLVFEINLNSELQQEAGVSVDEIRAVGGGSNSDYWLQLKSTVMNKPIKRMNTSEAGCLATMMLAGSAIDRFTLEEAVEKFVEVKDTFYPDDKLRDGYMEIYNKYRNLYKTIVDIYK